MSQQPLPPPREPLPAVGQPDIPVAYVHRTGQTWPKVIGIISIVIGGLGVLGSLMAIFLTAMTSSLARGISHSPMPPSPPLLLLLKILVSGLLVVAGVTVLRRHPAAQVLCLLYVGLSVVLHIAWLWWNIHMAPVYASRPPFTYSGEGPFIAMALFGAIWGMAYPGFLVIWFLRANTRRDVAAWRVARSQRSEDQASPLISG